MSLVLISKVLNKVSDEGNEKCLQFVVLLGYATSDYWANTSRLVFKKSLHSLNLALVSTFLGSGNLASINLKSWRGDRTLVLSTLPLLI